MEFSQQQRAAAALLKRALAKATETGLLDQLAAFAPAAQILGVCDGLSQLAKAAQLDKDVADQVTVEHWNSPRYRGDADQHNGMTFTAEVVDQREDGGRLMVSISDDNGHVDHALCAAFEVSTEQAGGAAAPVLMLYGGEEVLIKIIATPSGHLIEPMKPGIQIIETCVDGNPVAWRLQER